jgi:enamine deaminase RidA (YjgF/YER057c/UK114 family)
MVIVRRATSNGCISQKSDAQFKQTFRSIEKTLAEAGAKLSDIATMTVFLIDARYTTRMTELRGELFGRIFRPAPPSRCRASPNPR